MTLPTDRTVFQHAWVVDDLEAAVERWATTLGIGPFFLLDHSDDLVDTMYRGEPASLSMRLALAQAGPVQVELIQPKGDGPNCYRDLVPAGTTGFHHICMWTHDIDADTAHFAAHGCPAVNTGRVRDSVRFAYYDARDTLGCMVEVMERSDEVEALFQSIAVAAVGWEGDDPLRTL